MTVSVKYALTSESTSTDTWERKKIILREKEKRENKKKKVKRQKQKKICRIKKNIQKETEKKI